MIRPMGIGVQGMSDMLMKLRVPFEDSEATKLNHDIFETIYHAALTESLELSKEKGPYEKFQGSP